MREAILKVALAAACATVHLVAQPSPAPPVPKPAAELQPNARPEPAAGTALPEPEIIFDATAMGSPMLLDKNWRVGITSDPAAASPGFDDSGWALRNALENLEEVPSDNQTTEERQTQPKGAHVSVNNQDVGSPGQTGAQPKFAWFRLHIRLAPHHGPVALLIELPISQAISLGIGSAGPNPTVFANGNLIVPAGPHGDVPARYQQISRLYNLNVDPSVTSLTLVVGTAYIPFGYGAYTGFFANRRLSLGDPDDLQHELDLWSNRNLFERLPRLIYSTMLTVLGIFLLALYFSQKGHPEYMWLALHELVQAPIGFVELAGSSARLDSLWYAALWLQLVLLSAYLFFEFLISFLSLRWRWYIRALRISAPLLIFVGPTLLMVGHGKFVLWMLVLVILFGFLWLLGWSLFIFSTLIKAALRKNLEAGMLLIPLLLTLIGVVEPVLTASMNERSGHEYQSPLTLMAGPVPIHFASIADFTGILAIVLIIFFRFLRIHRVQERVTSELAAARSVQELMIPREKQATPGFQVDSVYNPANEVGGDFFYVQPTADGGMLVVIGDVAGKGLKAAMSVSMLMGAMRGSGEQSPAKILQSLNRVLVGSESFTTCQAAWFGAHGQVVFANAGHLRPYMNSQEIPLPGGLPLGVIPEVRYEEVRLYLHPGDRILLYSDGVVEARRPSGELFGFDRVHNMSNQTAFYLAEAAKAFGQEDDITVLTVQRLAQTMAA